MEVDVSVEPESDVPYVASESEFLGSESDGSEDEEVVDGADEEVGNEEIASLLQRKTEPPMKKNKHRKAAQNAAEAINEKLQVLKCKRNSSLKAKSKGAKSTNPKGQQSSTTPPKKKVRTGDLDASPSSQSVQSEEESVEMRKRPPIYYFYDIVPNNAEGKPAMLVISITDAVMANTRFLQ
ncbi:hypothetical protein M422DRAFT_51518 [Sphaerobolus stellatus SS14]|uniref:Uncharacterized protein n=1 Tax=Sphaerobolus stellatus (strain SS14) TaxID=990650 RepID=A0A0C9VDI3_SPHS4|nr:hypothetical protein M422DRAFT_51518 [Sphaerobolus stellatus SS14]